MALPTVALSEATPAGSDQIALGDNRIREYKTQNREILEVDHTYPSSGQSNDAGTHKKCSFIEQADLGTGAVGKTLLGSQTVSGKGELVYSDEDDNDIQLTSGGKVNLNQVSLASVAGIMSLIYPVGSYYFNDSVSTNPGTLLGIGTWVAVEEVVLVGYKSGSAEFGTAGGAYGSKTHTLTVDEIPSHAHETIIKQSVGSLLGSIPGAQWRTDSIDTDPTESTGGGGAHNNCQPSRTVYMWRRTA